MIKHGLVKAAVALLPVSHQSLLLQSLSEDAVLWQDVTQQEVVFLFLCKTSHSSDVYASPAEGFCPAGRRVCELTHWTPGVSLDHAAEICDGLLQKPAPPVGQVPEDTDRNTPHLKSLRITYIIYLKTQM